MISNKSASLSLPPFQWNVADFFQIQLDEGSEPDHEGTHTHPYHEIIYCRSNCGAEFQLLNTRYHLQRGDIIMVPPETPHAWLTRSRVGEPYMGYRLCMDPEHITLVKNTLPDFHIPNDVRFSFFRTQGTIWEQLGEIFRNLYEETHFKATGWEAASFACSIYLLIQLARAISTHPSASIQSEKADLVDVVISYINANLGEKLTLEHIAQKFWVSPSTITHLFNKKLGISFYKYVTGQRLAEAKNLISEGMPMEKIAVRVGFGDYSAFYRAFKKEFGISPSQHLQTLGR